MTYIFFFNVFLLTGGCRRGVQFCHGPTHFSCHSQHGFVPTRGQEVGHLLLFHQVRLLALVALARWVQRGGGVCRLGSRCVWRGSYQGRWWTGGASSWEGAQQSPWGSPLSSPNTHRPEVVMHVIMYFCPEPRLLYRLGQDKD